MNFENGWCVNSNEYKQKKVKSRKRMIKEMASVTDYTNFRRIESLARNVSGLNVNGRLQKYVAFLLENDPRLLIDNILNLQKYDDYGNPYKYDIVLEDTTYNISDSLVPPLFALHHINKYLGNISLSNIIEIGCGFGINTVIFHDLVPPSSYTHIDLPEMLALQKNYLTHYNINDVTYINPTTQLDRLSPEYDLLISDFAFTEFSNDLKKLYFNEVITRCHKGIIIGKGVSNLKHLNALNTNDVAMFKEKFHTKIIRNTSYKGCIFMFSDTPFQN